MRIFFSVGEPSGDQHAAHLIEELRCRQPGIECAGFGGPLMERAGCDVQYRLTDLAVMFVWSVVPLLWTFFKLLRRANRYFQIERPDAVVLVDFPGFNWWIARKAKAAGIPVFYYLPPQLWAWGSWRVKKVRRFVDHLLCGLPFEADWYAQRNIQADYVGHPFFDEVAAHHLDQNFAEQLPGETPSADFNPVRRRYVGVLPGSRDKEVIRNWPIMLEVLRKLRVRHPDVRFLVASFNDEHRQFCEQFMHQAGYDLPVEMFVGRTPEIIDVADCCLMVSGSVSLEMLARATPAVVVYRVSRLTHLMKQQFLKCPYITLPNLIAGREMFPEFVVSRTPRAAANRIAAAVDAWLSDPDCLSAAVAECEALKIRSVKTGATCRTAKVILDRTPSPAIVSREAA